MMPGCVIGPRPLRQIGRGALHPDDFGSSPTVGKHVGRIAHVYFGDDVVTLDLWIGTKPGCDQARFQFNCHSPFFKALVDGAPPYSGRVFMGRGDSYAFNSMKIQFAVEDSQPVNGYPRAKLVDLTLTPWPTSLNCKQGKGTQTLQKVKP